MRNSRTDQNEDQNAEKNQEIRCLLEELKEPKYQKFASSLIPNLPPEHILGVRLPKLRKVAARIGKEDWRRYLDNAADDSFEEIMLQGMVIGCAKMDLKERFAWTDRFLPKIDNWSVCDSFCAGLKAAKDCPEEVWAYIKPYFECGEEYKIRFAVVMAIYYFMDEAHLEEALLTLDRIRHGSYYVKMAVAWAVSIYYVHFPAETKEFLEHCSLDDFTFNKALQKVCESRLSDPPMKALMRKMKRPVSG